MGKELADFEVTEYEPGRRFVVNTSEPFALDPPSRPRRRTEART